MSHSGRDQRTRCGDFGQLRQAHRAHSSPTESRPARGYSLTVEGQETPTANAHELRGAFWTLPSRNRGLLQKPNAFEGSRRRGSARGKLTALLLTRVNIPAPAQLPRSDTGTGSNAHDLRNVPELPTASERFRNFRRYQPDHLRRTAPRGSAATLAAGAVSLVGIGRSSKHRKSRTPAALSGSVRRGSRTAAAAHSDPSTFWQ